MKKIYGYMLGFSSLFMINSVYAQSTCVEPPSCGSLGYNEISKDCSNGAIKCPWDISKVFCLKLPEKIETCNVGDILYSDKSCSKVVVIGKKAIAIVFDKNKRLAVALEQSSSLLGWAPSGKGREDVILLDNCDNSSTVYQCSTNGKDNTSKIVAQYGKDTYYASGYCVDYITPGTSKGDWFLLSMEELHTLNLARDSVNPALVLLGKPPLTKNYHWTSTERDSNTSWKSNISGGTIQDGDKGGKSYVRPVIVY